MEQSFIIPSHCIGFMVISATIDLIQKFDDWTLDIMKLTEYRTYNTFEQKKCNSFAKKYPIFEMI